MTYTKYYCYPCEPNKILEPFKSEVCECSRPHENEYYMLNEKTNEFVKLINLPWHA